MIALPGLSPRALFGRWLDARLAREEARHGLRLAHTALSLYRAGIVVRCTEGVPWRSFQLAADESHAGPRQGDVLRVVDLRHHDGEAYLIFAEWPGCAYRARHFQPLPEDC